MKILIATDGSIYSKAAISFCRELNLDAKDTNITIISAVEHPMPIAAEPFAISAEYYNEVEQAERKVAKQVAEQAEKQIRSFFINETPDVKTEVISGSPSRAIVEKAQEWGADLIILGSHGYGFWSRTLLGSVSDSVTRHAPCSVLVVRKSESTNGKRE